jgi:hypothetical protein
VPEDHTIKGQQLTANQGAAHDMLASLTNWTHL